MRVFYRNQYLFLLCLAVIILLLLVVGSLCRHISPQDTRKAFLSQDTTVQRKHAQPQRFFQTEEKPVETFPFDPNTADSTTLLRLGLSPSQVRFIYSRRAKHSYYTTPEDFQYTPGLTQGDWERLAPMIRIGEQYRPVAIKPRPIVKDVPQPVAETPKPADTIVSAKTDTLRPKRDKFAQLTQVDLNTADTTLLKRIPGIASYRARQIVEYRQRLGGYVAVGQVMEACKMPDEVFYWFVVEQADVRQIDINNLSVKSLMRHPYISFYQARDIDIYRKKHGAIHQVEELLKLDAFTADDVARLKPYLQHIDTIHKP